jgi:hypothetical protein
VTGGGGVGSGGASSVTDASHESAEGMVTSSSSVGMRVGVSDGGAVDPFRARGSA